MLDQHRIRSGEGVRDRGEGGVSDGEASVSPMEKLELADSFGKVRLK